MFQILSRIFSAVTIILPLVFAGCGYIVAEQWMIDGIILAIIIASIYGAIDNKFNED